MSDRFPAPRIAVLTSGSASGIEQLLASPNRGSVYDLVAVISSEENVAEEERIAAAGVPLVVQPFGSFHRERRLPPRNLYARAEYDAEIADQLRRLHTEFVILAGYRYIVTDPLLEAFPQRIIAMHDGDLTIRDDDGRRINAGPHPVRDAILRGATATRTSAYVVTRDVAEGPLFLMSRSFPVAAVARDARDRGAIDDVLAYAELHRRWMRRDVWGEMLTRIAEILAAGTMQIVGDVAWIDGVPGPCRMGEAPSMCDDADIVRGIPATCPFITR